MVSRADLQNKSFPKWGMKKLLGSTGKLAVSFNESFVLDFPKEIEGGLEAIA